MINNQVVGSRLEKLKAKADFIIIDTPPTSVSADAVAIAEKADATVLVVRTDCVLVEDINEAVLNITESGGKLEGCILNNVYEPFTLFGQIGVDERGYYSRSNHYGYGYGYSRPAHTNTDGYLRNPEAGYSYDSSDDTRSDE